MKCYTLGFIKKTMLDFTHEIQKNNKNYLPVSVSLKKLQSDYFFINVYLISYNVLCV